jgi:hypothetical protein
VREDASSLVLENGEKPDRSRLVLVDSALALRLPRA